jgi:membrane-bound lytic murein transglycosylase MltF
MRLCTVLVVAATLGIPAVAAPSEQPGQTAKPRQLSLENKPWKGDFDAMLQRRMIRVLVPYSRTLYFVDKGRERGVTADLVRDFERYLNRKYARELGKRPLTVYIIPTTRDRLLTGLNEGLGDVAAGNLTATDGRRKVVDFAVFPDDTPVRELIVTGPSAPAITTLDDLSGRKIHVRKATSYYESVEALNGRLKKAGKAPARIVELSDALEDEDKLEMLNAGVFEFVVVDDWKARMWAQILPKIKVREDLVLRAEGHIGWALRKDSPRLVAELMEAYREIVVRQGGLDRLRAQYHKRIKQITNNTGSAEWRRFEQAIRLFEKYGERYGFDPLMLAAQGYQESRLDQRARSHVGAVGVMQIMPATGKHLAVGDIHEIEPNIHAGAKYMDQLMARYFPDARFTAEVRPLFAFASYNAGPGKIARMRREAAKRGLNPDKWFNNVEIVVSERIGLETTTYVRNIYKYYTAYRLTLDAQLAQRAAREKVRK